MGKRLPPLQEGNPRDARVDGLVVGEGKGMVVIGRYVDGQAEWVEQLDPDTAAAIGRALIDSAKRARGYSIGGSLG